MHSRSTYPFYERLIKTISCYSLPNGLEWVDVKDNGISEQDALSKFTVNIYTYGSEFLVRKTHEKCQERTNINFYLVHQTDFR